MAASFPVTFPSALSITGTQTLEDVGHTDNLHIKDRDEIIAAQTKLGLGSSVASGTTALLGTGGTQSAWGQITNAYISGTAAIAVSKLGTVTASRPLVSNSGGTLVAGTITTDMIAAGTKGYGLLSGTSGAQYDPISRRNRVTNGDMRVKQRTTLGSADDTYTLDLWNLLLEAASAAAASQETSDVPTDGSKRALKLTVGSGEDNKFGIVNCMEFLDVSDLRGKTISLQAKLKATAAITDVRMAVLEWTGTADSVTSDVVSSWGSAGTNPTLAANWAYLGTPANLSVTTSWATYKSEGLTVGASANNLAVFIWCEDESTTVTTDSLLITDVQLEEGAVCTAFDRIPYSDALSRCLRYVRVLGANGNGTYNTATRILLSQTFDPPMRAAPTATLLTSAFQILEVGIGFQTGTGSTIVGSSLHARGVYLDIDGFSGLTADKEIRVVSADVALFSAEL